MEIPKHIGIIMDGNRRFASTLNKETYEGHKAGVDKLEEVLDWCRELGIKNLTVWAFSTENLNRTKEELDFLFQLMIESANKLAKDKRVFKNKIKLSIIGDLNLLPKQVQEAFQNAMNVTKDHDQFFLNIALGYGGKAEIVDATKRIAEQVKQNKIKPEEITSELIEANMYSSIVPDVDLVIRTSGEQRTSGFMLWKSDYAEYYFCNKYWPEFSKEDLVKAVMDYTERKRRYGK